MSNENSRNAKPKKLSLFQVMTSSLAAMIGVQSHENRKRDFARGSAIQFIIVGVVLTAILAFTLIFIVGLVVM